MSDEPSNPDSAYRHHDDTPGSAADRSAKTAVPDSFPASDPVATTPAVGLRAVHVSEMMEPSEKPEIPNAITVTALFAEHVTAKLALEKLVRDVPLDRRYAALSEQGGRTILEVTAPKPDLDRITEMLLGCGGEITA